jgi:hypothetical protein
LERKIEIVIKPEKTEQPDELGLEKAGAFSIRFGYPERSVSK